MILTGAEIDTLVSLVERGPLQPGGIPSKVGLNGLLTAKFSVQVVIDQDVSSYAATMTGLEWYLQHYQAENIKDAKTNRLIRKNQP